MERITYWNSLELKGRKKADFIGYLNKYRKGQLSDREADRVKRGIELVENDIEADEKIIYKGILTLYYYDRMSWERIAEYYDSSLKSVMKFKDRAISKLYLYVFPDEALKVYLGIG